ncbi:NADH-ubiquinone oxidoreductase [Corchorus capsularis]|uniref:NADH-ubiquinone oxidoreductase n=1 Tax=Corchorus capsularis TaxID=210143 RepID=A0A1R3K3P2_COCAP|nr:NADH-ubiquinone oxidoreductase [Corchorus capsularis]
MAFVQRRKGPDVVGSFGLLQPLADGVERSTLHRCGLTGLGLKNLFFHSSIGPWSVTFRVGIDK